MFGKLKEKLKSWFTRSKEKIEEDAEKVKTPKKEKKVKKEIKTKTIKEQEVKKQKKAEEPIKKVKLQEAPEPPKRVEAPEPPKGFETVSEIFEPGIKKEDSEKLQEELKNAQKQVKDIKDFKHALEKAKEILEESEEDKSERALKEVKPEEVLEKPFEKKSFFRRLTSAFSYKISENEFNEIFDDLEMLLLENNVALEVVEELRSKLAVRLIDKQIKRENLEEEIKNELKNSLNEIIIEPDNPLEIIKNSKKPFIILFFGINGTGKTTSIAKIAYFLKSSGHSVVLAAADTFRAASIEQLSEHAKKLKVPMIKHDYGSDPAAVGFDAIKYAENHKIDVVLIDTAGRMHTKTNLIEEMKKIERVTKPDLKIFVAESIAGNDATEQARTFNNAIEIDGAILSKADVDEKGGTIISVSHATNKPIFYLGTGQNYEDLELFNKQKFIESLGL